MVPVRPNEKSNTPNVSNLTKAIKFLLIPGILSITYYLSSSVCADDNITSAYSL